MDSLENITAMEMLSSKLVAITCDEGYVITDVDFFFPDNNTARGMAYGKEIEITWAEVDAGAQNSHANLFTWFVEEIKLK